MQVLMLVINQKGKGTYFRTFEFARQLVARGHEVTLLATSPANRLKHSVSMEAGVKIIETPDLLFGSLRSGWDLYNALYRWILIKKIKFDIAYAFETRPVNLLPVLAIRRSGIPIVFDWADWFGRGGSVEERPNPFIKKVLRPVETFFEENFRNVADSTTVICSILMQRAIEIGVDKETIHLLYNGFDYSNFKRHNKSEARNRIGFDKDCFIVGYLGSLFPRDTHLMADSINLLIQKMRDIKFLHIGQTNYGVSNLLKKTDCLVETGNISQSEMEWYLSACDICWLPLSNSNANNGRFPMKLSNYVAAGKPILATNVGDISQIINELKIGVVVSDNPESLANAAMYLFDNKGKIQELESAIDVSLINNPEYTWENLSSKLEEILNTTVNKKKTNSCNTRN
ncbi:MAG: putative teichuronic acid biosynthesis glycosyltransferase TuaH [Firmicutes bacterium ADurb.Bin419]|nr:MAG: putative teichuronic acid biosynthesis glycosyltransferase TuaH [Firmicutes bacterium ADurb.Bin419]